MILLRDLFRVFKARFRFDLDLVCRMSRGMGRWDYHDWPDDCGGRWWHGCWLFCDRCGKPFKVDRESPH